MQLNGAGDRRLYGVAKSDALRQYGTDGGAVCDTSGRTAQALLRRR